MSAAAARTMMMALLCGSLLASSGGARAEVIATDGAVADTLLTRMMDPVLRALQEAPEATGVAIRLPAGPARKGDLHDEVGNFLYERGYEIWTLEAGREAPEGSLLLDFEVQAAGVDYPREKGGFLGFGESRILRRAALGVTGRLEDPDDGRWLWRGAPLVQHEQWVPRSRREALAGDRPAWIAGTPLPAIDDGGHWWERGLVAGLLAGVVVLYFDGTQ